MAGQGQGRPVVTLADAAKASFYEKEEQLQFLRRCQSAKIQHVLDLCQFENAKELNDQMELKLPPGPRIRLFRWLLAYQKGLPNSLFLLLSFLFSDHYHFTLQSVVTW